MTKSEKIILRAISEKNGLVNASILSDMTGYAFSTCKAKLKKFQSETLIFKAHDDGPYFFLPSGERALKER